MTTRETEETLEVMTYRRVVRETSDSVPPTPRRPALRVVTTSGETLSESIKMPAKCRQITPVVFPSRKKAAG
jgi:hypothetical protein